jgi:ribosomal protein L29
MKKYNEIASMGAGELQHELEKSRKELHELRIGNALKQLKDTHKIKETRRYIAQLKTVLQQGPVAAPITKEVPAQEEEKKVTKSVAKTGAKKREPTQKERLKKESKAPSKKTKK